MAKEDFFSAMIQAASTGRTWCGRWKPSAFPGLKASSPSGRKTLLGHKYQVISLGKSHSSVNYLATPSREHFFEWGAGQQQREGSEEWDTVLEAALGTPMSPSGFWGEEIPFFLVSPSLASPVRGVWLREAKGKHFYLENVPGPGYDNLGKGPPTTASSQTQPGWWG